MNSGHPLTGLTGFWDDTIADMEATAEEFREAGWETVELHPGAVTPLPSGETEDGYVDERVGLDVLVPGNEFEAVTEAVGGFEGEEGDAASYTEYEAFRAQQDGVVFLVVAMKAPATETAVLIPLYYKIQDASETVRRVREQGEMRLFVRPLDDSERVVFSQQSPSALLPGDEA
jgi:hypothetical protein